MNSGTYETFRNPWMDALVRLDREFNVVFIVKCHNRRCVIFHRLSEQRSWSNFDKE